MTDIVEWLRNAANEHNMYRCEEASDEIEGLTERVVVLRKVVQDQLNEVDRLREALEKVLSVQPIRGDEGSTDIIALAKALLEIDSIARAALKEKE